MDSLNSNTSDHDEFEFKPLTEGLGFHQKKSSSPKPLVQFKNELPDLELNTPLPRAKKTGKVEPVQKNLKQNSDLPSPQNTVEEILKTLHQKKSMDFTGSKEKLKVTAASPTAYKASAWDLSASLLDAMLVTAATLFCLILLLVVTRVDLFANLYRPNAQAMVYLSLIALVASIAWIYLVGNRLFLGFTPGEWVFDQRLGRPEDQNKASYMLKTVLRSTLVVFTGFIFFPIISFAMNNDFLGKLIGLPLMKRQ